MTPRFSWIAWILILLLGFTAPAQAMNAMAFTGVAKPCTAKNHSASYPINGVDPSGMADSRDLANFAWKSWELFTNVGPRAAVAGIADYGFGGLGMRIIGAAVVGEAGAAAVATSPFIGGYAAYQLIRMGPSTPCPSSGFNGDSLRDFPSQSFSTRINNYRIDRKGMDRHTSGNAPGKSQFGFRVNAEQTTLDAAEYADYHSLWDANNKATVSVNDYVGVYAKTGERTTYINVYRRGLLFQGNYRVHGAPGNPSP